MQVGGQDGAPAVVSGQLQVTEGDCRGQGPQEASHCPHSVEAETHPLTPKEKQARRYSEPASPSTPSWLAVRSTHLESAEARGRGTGKSGALLWVRICGRWGCRSLGLSEPIPVPGAPQKVQGPPQA